MAYSDKVLDHYNNPRNVGSFDQADADVGTGLVGAPECGDVMKLQIKVNPATGHDRGRQVQDVRLRLGHRVQQPGHRVAQGQDDRRGDGDQEHAIVEELALPPVKVHCSVLAEDAIKAAIKNYQEKQAVRRTDEAGRREVMLRHDQRYNGLAELRRLQCPP